MMGSAAFFRWSRVSISVSPMVSILIGPSFTPTRGFFVRRIATFKGLAEGSTARGSAIAAGSSARGSAAGAGSSAIAASTSACVFLVILGFKVLFLGASGAGTTGMVGTSGAAWAAGTCVTATGEISEFIIIGFLKLFKKSFLSNCPWRDSSIKVTTFIMGCSVGPFSTGTFVFAGAALSPFIFISNVFCSAGGLFIFNLAKRAAAISIYYKL